MSRVRFALLLAVAGGLGLAGSPQAHAKHISAQATNPTTSQVSAILGLLSNEQALLNYGFKKVSKQEGAINQLLMLELTNPSSGKIPGLINTILQEQVQINNTKGALASTQTFTVPGFLSNILFVTDPTTKNRLLGLFSFQQYNVNYFLARPSATPFAA